jgi:hypothetical protein
MKEREGLGVKEGGGGGAGCEREGKGVGSERAGGCRLQ